MMSISDDERREVARKLREMGPSADKHSLDYDDVCQRIDEIIGTVECDLWKVFFDRLADLIDPTCTVIVDDNLNESEGMGDVWCTCSECGWLLCANGEPEPKYCPHCGARVIGGNDAD